MNCILDGSGIMNSRVRSRKELENEIASIKSQINQLTTRNTDLTEMLKQKSKGDETSSGVNTLIKYFVDQNHQLTIILKEMHERLKRLESDLSADYYEQEDQDLYQQENRLAKVQPISGLDAQIMQIIQIRGLTTADDIRKQMNYKGRNAASARLNKLYKQGLLERYQLGHKVFYKYDAGKTTNTLIVSPPQ